MSYTLHNYLIPMVGFIAILAASLAVAAVLHTSYQDVVIFFLLFTVLRDSWLREVEKNRL